jgi:drug/metabolite transporter (DMT)-like permease
MNRKMVSWSLLILLSLIWGSSFILMKRGMHSLDGHAIFSYVQVGALRMLIAGIVLLPFAFFNLKKIQSFRHFLSLAAVGFFGNFFPAFLFTYAETGLSSGFAGMLNSFTPVFTVLIGYVVFKARVLPVQFLGLFIGILGVTALMVAGKQMSGTGSWWHIFAIVLATFMYGISLNTIKHTLHDFTALEITSLAFFIVLIPALGVTFYHNTFQMLFENRYAYEGLGFVSILSLLGTAIALILFNYIIQLSSPLFASSVTFFIPIVAVLIGLGFGEKISVFQIASMGVVLIGVLVVNVLGSNSSKTDNEVSC